MSYNAFGFLKNIHFVGIGGIGMSGIAEVLHSMDFGVTGSDIAENANVERLRSMGIEIHLGHRQENVGNADVVVYSSAVKENNPELVIARENFIPVIPRGEMLAELMRMTFAVAVCGSHGKTTTSSMVAEILSEAAYDPTVIIGGRLNRSGNNAQLGAGRIMVAEADESDRSFLMLYPTVAVITNIDYEHMESYQDMADVKGCFLEFANRVPFYGSVVVCLDDKDVADILPSIEKRIVTYGRSAQADVRALSVQKDAFSVSFDVEYKDSFLGHVQLQQPGDHNILNALAAIAVGMEMKVPFEVTARALGEFKGVQRRMSVRYHEDSTYVIDDYGHHPTEIAATLKAVRDALPGYRICVVFQPHRYSRTQSLMAEFGTCFFDADYLWVTDIYAASEKPIEGVDAESLVANINRHGFKNARYLPEWSEIYSTVEELGRKKLAVITFGAGSITKLSHELAEYLRGEKHA